MEFLKGIWKFIELAFLLVAILIIYFPVVIIVGTVTLYEWLEEISKR